MTLTHKIYLIFYDIYLSIYMTVLSLYFQWTHPPKKVVVPDLTGKVAIVTGANTGIGFWTAKRLAEKGARVIIACRSQEKGTDAVKQLKKEIGDSASVEFIQLDLENFQSVKKFVEKFNELNIALHILVNNAGIMACPYGTIENGTIERQIGVNHFGHFLLTNLLLPKLKASAPSRIVNVSSYANFKGVINFDDLLLKNGYTPVASYCQSKLANIVFSNELADRLKGTGVTSTSLHPGVVQTELMRYMSPGPVAEKFTALIFRTPEQGSDTSVFLAAAKEAEGETGSFWMECERFEPNPLAQDPTVKRRLWEVSHSFVSKYL